jgi:hypothetical protein
MYTFGRVPTWLNHASNSDQLYVPELISICAQLVFVSHRRTPPNGTVGKVPAASRSGSRKETGTVMVLGDNALIVKSCSIPKGKTNSTVRHGNRP